MVKLDISKHVLVPKHQKLSEKEKTELFKKYGISSDSLPRIVKDDVAIADLNLKVDDIVKITRQSSTAGVTVFYRVVVNA